MQRSHEAAGTVKGEPTRRSYAITVEFKLKPGCMDEFLALVRDNAATSVRDEADCSRFDVLVPRDPPGQTRSPSTKSTPTAQPSTCISRPGISWNSTARPGTWCWPS